MVSRLLGGERERTAGKGEEVGDRKYKTRPKLRWKRDTSRNTNVHIVLLRLER